MKYLAFLDIDGVFTSTRVQFASANPTDMWNKFDPIAVDFMNKLHDQVKDLYFVLISTWKEDLKTHGLHEYQWVVTAFRNAGFRGEFAHEWKTNPENDTKFFTSKTNRSHEIKEYLEVHAPEVEDYIIFDDTDFDFKAVLGKSRLVRTDSHEGLLFKHMKNVMSMVGTWEKRK